MWNFLTKEYKSNEPVKRTDTKAKKPAKPAVPKQQIFSRFSVEIRPGKSNLVDAAVIISGRTFSGDFNGAILKLFSEQHLDIGAPIAVTLTEGNKRIYFQGVVIWSVRILHRDGTTPIVTAMNWNYRVGVKLKFNSADDKAALDTLLQKTYPKPASKAG